MALELRCLSLGAYFIEIDIPPAYMMQCDTCDHTDRDLGPMCRLEINALSVSPHMVGEIMLSCCVY